MNTEWVTFKVKCYELLLSKINDAFHFLKIATQGVCFFEKNETLLCVQGRISTIERQCHEEY